MKNLLLNLFAVISIAAISCTPSCDQAYPEGMDLDYTDDKQRSMDGLDVVSFYISKNPSQGVETLSSTHNGVKFLFSTPENKRLFDGNPEKYMPQIGGYCVVAAAFGKVEAVDKEHYAVYNGKLYFVTNEKAYNAWMKDQEGLTNRGESMWPCLVAKEGREI